MPALEPYAGPTKLVLSFDIGTAYSSISYCILEPHHVPEVLTVARFPAQGVARADAKVPSLLYYDNTGTVRAAGAEVLAADIIETALTEGWVKAEWWKLHLCPKNLSFPNDLPPLPPGKSAVDILADFIKYLFDCCRTYIQECHPTFSWSSVEDSIEYILTYPGGWGEQRYLYRQAIEGAGLVCSTSERQACRVHILTEGEAGLRFCMSRLVSGETTSQATREGIVIIDGGGGIIDLSVFSIMSNSLSYEEIVPAESRLQGSIFVTRRARALIERRLEGWEHSSGEDIVGFTREFDQTTKPVIESDEEPAYVKVGDRRTNNVRYCISSGQLCLSGEEATGLFDDSVDAIIEAFERQKKSTATQITTAFFVGGLSANEWVWSRLVSYFEASKIRIYRLDNHMNKVVAKGAVLSRVDRSRRRTSLDTFRPDNHIDEATASGAMLSHVDRDNPLFAPKAVRPACDMMCTPPDKENNLPGQNPLNLWRAKGEKDDLKETLRVLEESSDQRDAPIERNIMKIRAVLCAHEQRQQGETQHAQGHARDATGALIRIANTASVEVRTKELIVDWITERLEKLGDDAMDSNNHNEAAEHFSTMLLLNPLNRTDILIKRSKVRVLMNSWEDALRDADEAIQLDPSCHRGYEMKHLALRGVRRHKAAVETFDTMLSKIEQSPHIDTRHLRHQYIDARPTILCIVNDTVRDMPRVLIDTTTGRLFDKQQQIDAFEAFSIYTELVSSMTTQLDRGRIQCAVKEFYQYAMLSHKWEKGEPLFQEVEKISIYDLEESLANTKLQRFCKLVRDLGFRWAWSDSSCVNKSNNVILQESLVAMFMWYHGSSLTVVYLRGVLSESRRPGGLRRSIWNTRAWTYQEYVAAKIIQFYTEDWKPYLDLTIFNHKDSLAITSEMQQASSVSAQEVAVLRPGLDRVREKLYLASRREATLVEDTAYSLFGIFNVAIPVIYGEGDRAVGRLLEHILNGSGDAAILAWTGKAGSYNSCLPKDLTVYNPLVPLHVPRPFEQTEMNRIMRSRSFSADLSLAKTLYDRLSDLLPPSLAANRLRLPGMVFPLTELSRAPEPDPVTKLHVYRVTTPTFWDMEIRTADNLTGNEGLWLVHPWIRPLLDQEFLCGATAVDKTKLALRFVARLRQPFGALLFAQLGRVEYKRVAADTLILARIHKEVSLTQLIDSIRTIEVL